jgi:hypothetical protein
MVIIGIGNEVDRKELETITDATDAGGVFIAPDPAKIGEIFLEAIASRSGAVARYRIQQRPRRPVQAHHHGVVVQVGVAEEGRRSTAETGRLQRRQRPGAPDEPGASAALAVAAGGVRLRRRLPSLTNEHRAGPAAGSARRGLT